MQHTLHQSNDQAGMFRSLAKATFTPRSAEAVAEDVANAIDDRPGPALGTGLRGYPGRYSQGTRRPVKLPCRRHWPARSVDQDKA